MITFKNILVATDFERAADAALRYGRTLAETFGATLHLLHVTDDVRLAGASSEMYIPVDPLLQERVEDDARAVLAQLATNNDREHPPTRIAVRTSHFPAAAIVEYAGEHRIDLIVTGTHGRRALAHLLMGSVAESVVRTAPCPVLTVHSPEHDFVLPDALVAVASASAAS